MISYGMTKEIMNLGFEVPGEHKLITKQSRGAGEEAGVGWGSPS